MKKLEVILKRDIVGLGGEGEIKQVACGYARNYLLPIGHAVLKTSVNLRKRNAELHLIAERKKEKLEASRSLVEKLNSLSLQFDARVSEGGKLFGSIGVSDIYRELEDRGLAVSKDHIYLTKPIKMLGQYRVPVSVHMDLKAELQVTVVSKGDQEEDSTIDSQTV